MSEMNIKRSSISFPHSEKTRSMHGHVGFVMLLAGLMVGFDGTSSADAGIWPWSRKKEEVSTPKDHPQAPPPDTGSLNAGIRNLLLDAHAAHQKGDLSTALRLAQRAEKLAKASQQVAGKPNELEGTASRFVVEITRQLEEKNKSLAVQEASKSPQVAATSKTSQEAAKSNTGKTTTEPAADAVPGRTTELPRETQVVSAKGSENTAVKAPAEPTHQIDADQGLRTGNLLLQSTAPVMESIASSSASSKTMVTRSQPENFPAKAEQPVTDLPDWAQDVQPVQGQGERIAETSMAAEVKTVPLAENVTSQNQNSAVNLKSSPIEARLSTPSHSADARDEQSPQVATVLEKARTKPAQKDLSTAHELPAWALAAEPVEEPEARVSVDFGTSMVDQEASAGSSSKNITRSGPVTPQVQAEVVSLREVVGEAQLPGWREITPMDIHQPARLDPLLRMQVEMAAAATRDLRQRILDAPCLISSESRQLDRAAEGTITLASNSRQVTPTAIPSSHEVSGSSTAGDQYAALRPEGDRAARSPLSVVAVAASTANLTNPTAVNTQPLIEPGFTSSTANRTWASQVVVHTHEQSNREKPGFVAESTTQTESSQTRLVETAIHWMRSHPVRHRWMMAAVALSVFSLLWWYGGRQLPSSRSV
ncbi:hypothetical protein [Planctopirus hydrillae]|nr:hypothetical protein [Planctopirus hydrillae]